MKRSEILVLAAILVAASALVYTVHYFIFHDLQHIFLFLLGDLAFLFLEVLLVGLVIDRILTRREKQAIIYKLNMVAGAFFSEMGTQLLNMLLHGFERRQDICPCLAIGKNWVHADFVRAAKQIQGLADRPSCRNIDLDALKAFLKGKRPFLLQLITNPNVLEHEHASNLLWAVFHLSDELEARASLGNLPQSDLEHLAVDIKRVYAALAIEWLSYMEHLKDRFPFLYSLMVRINPFQPNPSPIVLPAASAS